MEPDLALWSLTSHFTSLSLSFLSRKAGRVLRFKSSNQLLCAWHQAWHGMGLSNVGFLFELGQSLSSFGKLARLPKDNADDSLHLLFTVSRHFSKCFVCIISVKTF